MDEENSTSSARGTPTTTREGGFRPFRPIVLRASLALAAVDWVVLPLTMLVAAPEAERRMTAAFAVLMWPFIYAGTTAMVWVFGVVVLSADESWYYGPKKSEQVRLARAVMIPWINTVILLFPGVALVLALLGLAGVLPVPAD